ncbi:unnamed protein product [Absidia cylindrospora]
MITNNNSRRHHHITIIGLIDVEAISDMLAPFTLTNLEQISLYRLLSNIWTNSAIVCIHSRRCTYNIHAGRLQGSFIKPKTSDTGRQFVIGIYDFGLGPGWRLDQASTVIEFGYHPATTTTTTPTSLDTSELTHFICRSMVTHLGRVNEQEDALDNGFTKATVPVVTCKTKPPKCGYAMPWINRNGWMPRISLCGVLSCVSCSHGVGQGVLELVDIVGIGGFGK